MSDEGGGVRLIKGDGARADDPALDALLAKAQALHPVEIDLSLNRLLALLAKLGDPHKAMPPALHIAGTNGKGSVAAFLRSCMEAAGKRVHVYTSPHLVRFNERIRLAGSLIEDAELVKLLEEVMAVNGGDPITFFELTTATAFLAFARREADALVLETGLGGRFDATNVVERPAVCGLAQISLDHERFLGNDVVGIAAEKAGIAKDGIPLVTQRYAPEIAARIAEVAGARGAPICARGEAWDAVVYEGALRYRDERGKVAVTPPRMAGAHQLDNAALAVAMLRHQDAIDVPDAALKAGIGWADWPARLQRLDGGALAALLPGGSTLFLDGGHNPEAGAAVGTFLAGEAAGRPVTLICGMIAGKDARGFLTPIAAHSKRLIAVPVPGHEMHEPAALAGLAAELGLRSATAANLEKALCDIEPSEAPFVLICGSLYLAGEALRQNGMPPD